MSQYWQKDCVILWPNVRVISFYFDWKTQFWTVQNILWYSCYETEANSRGKSTLFNVVVSQRIRITTKDVNCFYDRNAITEMERNSHSQNTESRNASNLDHHFMFFLFNSWKRIKELTIIKNIKVRGNPSSKNFLACNKCYFKKLCFDIYHSSILWQINVITS